VVKRGVPVGGDGQTGSPGGLPSPAKIDFVAGGA
jgi:hypothetical protein